MKLFMYMHETYMHARRIMLKVIKSIGFSVLNICELTTAINCEIPKLNSNVHFR